MYRKSTTVITFGKRRKNTAEKVKNQINADCTSCGNENHAAANSVMLFGIIVSAVFFTVSLSGITPEHSLSSDAARIESVFNDNAGYNTVSDSENSFSEYCVPVMSSGVEPSPSDSESSDLTVREKLRENIRSASGEAFGYMDGKWNLWEYLGDVMADLLIG